MMSVNYDLTCWYLNARRVMELTGAVPIHFGQASDHISKLHELVQLKDSAVKWMRANDPPTLGLLIAEGKLSVGSLFTHYSNFYFSGLPKVAEARRRQRPAKPAVANCKLDGWKPEGKLSFEFHSEHLTSNSAWSQLSGQKRSFVLAVVSDVRDEEIICNPYVIADIVEGSSSLFQFAGIWSNHLELHIEQIESFSLTGQIQIRHNKKQLEALRSIPETDVKSALAEIINEPAVPKDWGGEASDLFSSRIILDGRRISAAFLLKGPSKFHHMVPADLGKNGDQIGRLFDEPADLLILQHCHEVPPSVRKQMRAYAERMGRPKRFCIIDGYDTIRILKAYGKCGFTSDSDEGGEAT